MSGHIAAMGMSRDIPVAHIDPDPNQPRQHFDPAALDDLAQSMAASGLAVPILVRPVGERFVIVHGERRWRAAKQLGWATIPAIVRELDPETARWLSLVENVQRSDLTPLEEAFAFKGYLDSGITQTELGRRLGKSQSYIAQKLRLLTLPSPLATYLETGALSEGHLRTLLRIRRWYDDGAGGDGERDVCDIGEGVGLDYTDRAHVFALFRDIRPEDNPPGWIALAEHGPITPALTAACKAFDAWVCGRRTVPAWVIPAFWWASLAVYAELSVADLTRGLDLWHERTVGSMILRLIHDSAEPPTDPVEATIWWDCRADLRHAGLRDILPEDFDPGAVEELVNLGSVPLPSSLQSWGFGHERYQQLLADASAKRADVGGRL